MAKNDYSRRSEKDMFWSNDTQQDIKPDESAAPKAADAIVPPNNPSQPQLQSQKTPKEYIDIEKFISRNKDRFSRIILLKITVQIIAVVSAVAGAGATWPYSLINFIIVFFLFLGGVLSFSGLYDRVIKDAIKNITKIKNFSTSSNNKISWNSLIKVLKDSNDVRDTRCSELKISTDNATMTSFALKIYRTHYTNKIDDTMLYGECFYAEMDYKSLTADGLTLLYGKMPFFQKQAIPPRSVAIFIARRQRRHYRQLQYSPNHRHRRQNTPAGKGRSIHHAFHEQQHHYDFKNPKHD
ncbi:MAG: hypothetical protein J6T60_12085 [Bacteroidales bacterium]|nr:hypothetical protein [Bacteroidales bacterium]